MKMISAPELAAWLKECDAQTDTGSSRPVLLDVREDWEVQTCRLAGATHIPMRTIPARVAELDTDATIVCYCHHGMRSQQVAQWLTSQGFADVYNLAGGIDAWSRQVDPGVPIY